jgi:TPR repeat protein
MGRYDVAQPIFTLKYTLLLVAILSGSWAAAHFYYNPAPDVSNMAAGMPEPATDDILQQSLPPDMQARYDKEVDRALQFSLEGKYYDAAQILIPLAKKGFDRAQLYLAVAYYHGHGVDRDKKKAEQLFFELERKQYEPGIVHTYLNLLGSIPPA